MYKNLGQKAQIQAKELAVIPSLINYVEEKNIEKISELMNDIIKQSDASYIVIGDNNSNRLFHSQNAPLHVSMKGDDNKEVLNGNSIITIRKGSLGDSLRGKAPILNRNREVVGIVSVGYMIDHIDNLHKEQIIPIIFFSLIFLIALFIFSWLFARAIKKQMFNLEPKEIALLVKTQKSIMQSIFEGIIAIDLNYKIININQTAKSILGIDVDDKNLINNPLSNYIKPIDFIYGESNQTEDINDHICYLNQVIVIASRIRITIDNKLQGWVISFRNFNDINLMSMKLTQVTQYVDNLRALRHEHLNWMATLSGLISLGHYSEAQDFIALQSTESQQNLDYINQHFKIPTVCGLLIGKYAKANEMGLNFTFDPLCQLNSLPNTITELEFTSIIGNLLDNAFNACLKNVKGTKNVNLYLSDATDEIVLEVSDQGTGIDENIRKTMFEPGITSQNSGEHGIGLHLVETYTKKANGYITVSDNQPYGTIFSVFIPK
ncbi:ATP-binding protein [Orbaceae bacterium ac157xtp]